MKKSISVLLCLLIIASLCSCGKKDENKNAEKLEVGKMQSICELATSEVFYHNTVKLTKEKEVLWWDTSTELWVEYTGTVKIGIDVSTLNMKAEGKVVTITIPEAKILSTEVDASSLDKDSYYYNREGLGAEKIDADDQTKAFAMAQEDMEKTASANEELFIDAQQTAKDLLENYVKSVGDALGIDYEIRWVTVSGATVSTELPDNTK